MVPIDFQFRQQAKINFSPARGKFCGLDTHRRPLLGGEADVYLVINVV